MVEFIINHTFINEYKHQVSAQHSNVHFYGWLYYDEIARDPFAHRLGTYDYDR